MKLSGYRASHRNRWLLITNKILDEKSFLLFEYYLDCVDWDSSHEKHGVFEAYLDEIASFYGKSEDTIKSWHDKLLEIGLILLVDKRRNLYKVKSPERYAIDGRNGGKASKFSKEEKSNPTLALFLQNVCFSPEKVEIIPPKTQSPIINEQKPLSSSKGEFEVNSTNQSMDISVSKVRKYVVIRQEIRSEEEYQRLYEENGRQGFSIQDMKDADEIAEEWIRVENEDHEKEIVRIYFDGDWNRYQKYVVLK